MLLEAKKMTRSDSIKELKAKDEAIANQQKEIDALKQQLLAQSQGVEKKLPATKKAKTKGNNEEVETVLNFFNEETWKIHKFATHIQDLRVVMLRLFEDKFGALSPENKNLFLQWKKPDTSQKKFQGHVEVQEFWDKFANDVNQYINARRNYCQSEVKKTFHAFVSKYPTPSLPDLFLCFKRRLDPKNPNNHNTIFCWANVILPSSIGNKHDYSENVRFYQTILNAHHRARSNYDDVTPETEAFAMLIVENCYSKWVTQRRLLLEKSAEIGDKRVQIAPEKKPSHDKKGQRTFFLYESEHPGLKTKYTKSYGGQQEFGGWTAEGVKRWKELTKACRKYRKTDGGKTWEAVVLELLRQKEGIQGNTADEEKKMKGKKRKEEDIAAASEPVSALFSDDDMADDESLGSIHAV